jgi:hypothetical protein
LSKNIPSAKNDDSKARYAEKRCQFRLGHLIADDLAPDDSVTGVHVVRPGQRFFEGAVVSMLRVEDLAVGSNLRPTGREALIEK